MRLGRTMKNIALALSTVFAAAFVAPAPAASWYQPDHSGHGLAVDVLSDESALLMWFTYDFGGHPMPLYAEARRSGNAYVGTAYAPFGPRFNDFDPRELVFEPWGTLGFAPSDCDDATLSWNSTQGDGANPFGLGSLPLRPLTSGCAPRDAGQLAAFRGTWHHPQLQGGSVHVDVVAPGSALLYWFTYDALGAPMPVYVEASGTGQRLAGRAYAPRGLRFGSFARADLGVTEIGNVALEFGDCRHALFAYDTTLGDGSFPLTRLTRPQGTDCDAPAARPAWLEDRYSGRVETGAVGPGYEFVSVFVNARDEVFAWVSDGGIYRGGFVWRDGAPWLQLRRSERSSEARFGTLVEGPVSRDTSGRLVLGLNDNTGRRAEAVLDAYAAHGGQHPQGELRTLLPGSYGEDKCLAFVCFKRIDVHADLSYEAYEFGRVAFRGRFTNLDDAGHSFDFDARMDYGPRVVGSGRLEYGEALQPGGVRPLKLLLIGTGVGSGAYVFERADRAR